MLHPYYKLQYIEDNWGGAEEYARDVAAGVRGARDWVKYARETVDAAVSCSLPGPRVRSTHR